MSRPLSKLQIVRAEKNTDTGASLYRIAESGYPNGSPWTIEQYKESVLQESVHYFLAVLNEKAVGFVGIGVAGKEAEIYSIAVAEEAQRQGIGFVLLRHLIKELTQMGTEDLFLEVRVSNSPALRLYEKAGFQVIGKRPRYYSNPTEDAYVMHVYLKQED